MQLTNLQLILSIFGHMLVPDTFNNLIDKISSFLWVLFPGGHYKIIDISSIISYI